MESKNKYRGDAVMIKSVIKHINYLKTLGLPIYLACDGGSYSLLATTLMDEYLGLENYQLYATYLPCSSLLQKQMLTNYLESREGDVKIIDCEELCVPLNKEHKPINYNEACYYGACQKVPLTIQKDYGPHPRVSIISGAYDYPQIENCEHFKHFVPDEYSLIKPVEGSNVWTNPHAYFMYLFLGYNSQEIQIEAAKFGFNILPSLCWDELDKLVIREGCKKNALSPSQKTALLERFRRYRTKVYVEQRNLMEGMTH